MCLFSNSGLSKAQDSIKADIDQVKVVYIYNFSKYFTWPDRAKWESSPSINICIQNEEVAFGIFPSLNGQTSQGKTIKIISLDDQKVIDIKENCHIWFIDDESFERQSNQLDLYPQDGVLTISDHEGFIDLGGVIELVIEDSRVKFRINADLAASKGLEVSSLLLSLGISDE